MLSEVLLRALALHEGAGYALEGEVSDRKLSAAREAMEIPPGERVLALLDTTLLGNGRAGLAVGEQGLYFVSNGAGARVHHMAWGEFLSQTMVMDDELGYVQLGAGRAVYPSLRPGLSMFTTARIYALLMDLRTTLRLAMREGLLANALAQESAPPAAPQEWELSYKGERFGPFDLTLAARLLAQGRPPIKGCLARRGNMGRFEPVLRWPELMNTIRQQREYAPDAGAHTPHPGDWLGGNTPAPQAAPPPVLAEPIEDPFVFGEAPEEDEFASRKTQEKHLSGKLNLNRATVDDLLGLPHLSVEDAQELCQQRRRLGHFKSAQEALSCLSLPPHALMEISRLVAVAEKPAAPQSRKPAAPPPVATPPPDTHGLGNRLLDL